MKLTKEQVMVANGMKERRTSVRQLAKQLDVMEIPYRSLRFDEGVESYRYFCIPHEGARMWGTVIVE